MTTLASLRDCARQRVDRYTNTANHFAFRTYDIAPLTLGGQLRAEDILAANLLSLRLGWRDVIPLFADRADDPGRAKEQGHPNAPQDLLARMNEALAAFRSAPAFEGLASEAELESALAPLAAANEATRGVRGWTAVTVSKVLHRHVPHIVPIVDSRVREFYGVRSYQGAELRLRLWRDVGANLHWLRPLAEEYRTPDGRDLTVLRLVDIIIWTPDQ